MQKKSPWRDSYTEALQFSFTADFYSLSVLLMSDLNLQFAHSSLNLDKFHLKAAFAKTGVAVVKLTDQTQYK